MDADRAALVALVEEMHRWVTGALVGGRPEPTIPARTVGAWVTRFDDLLQTGPRYETANTCPACGDQWTDAIPTPGLLHRTRLCARCGTAGRTEP